MQIQRIIAQQEVPPSIERHSIKVVVTYLQLAKKSLKQIQIDATNHRDNFLQQKANDWVTTNRGEGVPL